MDKYEEKIIFEAIEFYENAPGFYDGKTTKTIKPIKDLVRSDVFRSFIR